MSILECSSRVYEGNHDVSRAFGDKQALVVVREAAGVHQQPTRLGVTHRTVVANETTPTALEVHI